MSGHATREELEVVHQMAAQLDVARSPIDDLLHLGQLYIEPMHQEERAIEIFNAILVRDSDHMWAKYWLAYCCVHYLMDNRALLQAKNLLESCILTYQRPSGAIHALLAEVLDDLEDPSLDMKINLLEESVRLEPEWVNNRMSLAWAYERAGRIDIAIRELERAKTNIVQSDPSWNIIRTYFEVIVTGRIGHNVAERIGERLTHLKQIRRK